MSTRSHGEMVQHPLRQISGLVKTDPLFEGVGALQFGWGARLHARMLGLKRGPEEDSGSFWMRIHRMGHQCMKKHNTSPVSTFRVQKSTERPVTSHASTNHTLWQKCYTVVTSAGGVNNNKTGRVNGNKWSGVHPARLACWRWEQGFEISYGKHTRGENDNANSVGWKALAQLRPEWKAIEYQL